ncbi:unnamed protein product [Urochloa humidicola]
MAESSKEGQARKALALAEKCFLAGNVPAARQWIQSAARLAPCLPGIAQAAAAYDVHAAAAARRPVDWYAVLGLTTQPRSSAGDVLVHDDVKRQHRRLCLLVHPDKNPLRRRRRRVQARPGRLGGALRQAPAGGRRHGRRRRPDAARASSAAETARPADAAATSTATATGATTATDAAASGSRNAPGAEAELRGRGEGGGKQSGGTAAVAATGSAASTPSAAG